MNTFTDASDMLQLHCDPVEAYSILVRTVRNSTGEEQQATTTTLSLLAPSIHTPHGG
jgi:hypothetical protein